MTLGANHRSQTGGDASGCLVVAWVVAEEPGTSAKTERHDQAEEFWTSLDPALAWEHDRGTPEARSFAHEVVKRVQAEGATDVADTGDCQVPFESGGATHVAESIMKGFELLPSVALKAARG